MLGAVRIGRLRPPDRPPRDIGVAPHSDIVREIAIILDGTRNDGVQCLDSDGIKQWRIPPTTNPDSLT